MKKRINLLQGTLDLLVLKTLSPEPIQRIGISRRIAQVTKMTFRVAPGSLFRALRRMAGGWLKPSRGESESNRRAKYFRLTNTGQRQMEAEAEDRQRLAITITSAMKVT